MWRILLLSVLLTGCTVKNFDQQRNAPIPPLAPIAERVPTTIEDDEEEVSALEQVPSELSIAHFGAMRLEGTNLVLERIIAVNEAYTQHAISYRSNGLLISGILNIPKGEGPFPLVIFNHGHIPPSIYTRGRGLRREQDFLARKGFAILHTDYRGHGESDESPDARMVYDAGLEYAMDSVNAILALRDATIPGIDAERVGMLGHSLGGGVTLNILTAHPDLVDAAILYAPVHSDAWENFSRWRDMRDEGDRTRAALGTREENPSAWDALSSKTYLSNIIAPILLFHGTEDSDVPQEWSDFLSQKLYEEGKDVTYVLYQNEKHEFIPKWPDFMEQSAAFLHEHLSPPPHDTPGTLSLFDSSRITKKPFGIFITPEHSPVSPERFRGYHTGTDFEVLPNEDETSIAVPALCDGSIIHSGTVNGYGGVLIQRCVLHNEEVTVLYGHLAPASLKAVGSSLKKSDQIGFLGKGHSEQAAGERPHLHLAIHRGSEAEYRGYVESEQELAEWIDPMQVIRRGK